MPDDSENLGDEHEAEDDRPAETPLDHPLFMPVVLAGLCLYFFYDGFINQDPKMLENLAFNRGGFWILLAATLWFGYKGWKEMRQDASRDGPADDDNQPIG